MHRFGLLALVVGCGGAGGLTIDDVTADVQIANPSCQLFGTDMADITVEGLFTLAEGDAVDADFALAGPPVAMVSGFFSCGSWSEVFDTGGESTGCVREPGAPISMQAVNITHNVTASGTISDPTNLTITLHVRDGQGGSVIASDTMMVTCSSVN